LDITYLGRGSIKVSGKQISLVSDPEAGKKLNADVVIVTSPDVKAAAPGEAMLIDGPGEYEVKNSLITGVPTQLHVDAEGQRGTAYVVEVDSVRIGIVGNIAPGLNNEQLELLGGVDVLVVPVGGHGLTLDATAATELVSQVEPKYVIPVHYDDGVSKYDMPQEKLDKFLSEMGAAKAEPVPKFKLSDKDLPLETTVVVLELAR
jgi:L-ascorbate metabolism protein UlaG (beta-lactamase superfamily)